MHRCFQIPEVLTNILDFLSLQEPPAKTTLLSVALTCRFFAEPGLDALWQKLDSPYPLIQCMGIVTSDAEGIYRTICEPISSHHLAVMKSYTKRVRIIDENLNKNRILYFDTPPWPLLYDIAGDSILPNARRISVDVDSHNDYCKLRLLIGENLQQLSISVRGRLPLGVDLALASYFANQAFVKHPLLTELEIGSNGRLAKWSSPAIYGNIHRFPLLRALKLPEVAGKDLHLLSEMPLKSLKRLAFEAQADESSYDSPFPVETCNPFPSLENLELRCWESVSCVKFLGAIHPQNIVKSITMATHHAEVSSHLWESILNLLSSRLSSDTLQSLDVADFNEGEAEEDLPINRSALVDFSRFHNLVVFKCHSSQGFELDDELVNQLAKAWPCITFIRFSAETRRTPRNTLSGLTPFAEHCPRLEELWLAFNTSHPPHSRIGLSQKRAEKLRVLNVQASPLSDPKKVAAFLSDIFPRLCRITVGVWLEDDKLEGRWKQVQKDIHLFAEMREHERNATLKSLSTS